MKKVSNASKAFFGKAGNGMASSTNQPRPTWSKKLATSSIAKYIRDKFNIVDPNALNKAAEFSMKATATRQNAELMAMFSSAAAGSAAVVGVAGVATGPLAPAFLGLSLLLIVLLRQRGMNLELYANLIAIQGEADEMFMIMSVVETICKEYSIDLDTGTVRLWLTKVTNYIAIIAGPSALDVITSNRDNLQKLVTDKSTLATGLVKQAPKGKWSKMFDDATSFFYRTVAPGEYLRVLIREIVILDIFFGIMMSKFNLFLLEKGEQAKKDWVSSPAYKLLKDTNRVTATKFSMIALQQTLAAVNSKNSSGEEKKRILAAFLAKEQEKDKSFYGNVESSLDATKEIMAKLAGNPSLAEEIRGYKEDEIKAVVEKTGLPEAAAEELTVVAEEAVASAGQEEAEVQGRKLSNISTNSTGTEPRPPSTAGVGFGQGGSRSRSRRRRHRKIRTRRR